MKLATITKKGELNVFGVRCFRNKCTNLVDSQLNRAHAIDSSELVADFNTTRFSCISIWKDLGNPAAAIVFMK